MQRHDKSGVVGFAIRRTALTVALLGSVAMGAPGVDKVRVSSKEDPVQPGEFFLSFDAFGVTTSGAITSTDYALEVDTSRGESRLVEYFQHVEPLILPGGFDTGAITVALVPGSSRGTYDAFNGRFTTKEEYAVFFEGDLSAFDLVSPVVLPSSSAGFVELNGAIGGRVDLEWVGDGELSDPFQPGQAIAFSYTCSVKTIFDARADLLVRLQLMPDLEGTAMPVSLNGVLLEELLSVRDLIDAGMPKPAVFGMTDFIDRVQMADRRNDISAVDASGLILGAEDVIDVLDPPQNRKHLSVGGTIR